MDISIHPTIESVFGYRAPHIIAQAIDAAQSASRHAYAPYSHFRVGSAIVCSDESVVAGCNVENASYGATICAERGAVMSAIAAGKQFFVVCVIVTPTKTIVPPCGMCRQVLAEFAPDMLLLSVCDQSFQWFELSSLFPERFSL
jgi:cytidine deaminase